MNEKVAGVCFPDLKGKIDFNSGFRGTSDTEFHNWCRDLFELRSFFNSLWNQAELYRTGVQQEASKEDIEAYVKVALEEVKKLSRK
jgi:hypothetical protein